MSFEDYYRPPTKVINEETISDDFVTEVQAENYMQNIDTFANLISELLNKFWGENWGTFGSELSRDENSESEINLPQITYDYSVRRNSKEFSAGYKEWAKIKEIRDGKSTGDSFTLFKKREEYILEFQVYDVTHLKARSLMRDFEIFLQESQAKFKEQGLSLCKFAQEISYKDSIRYDPDIKIPIRCLQYLIHLETNDYIRTSTLRGVKTKVNII